MRVWPLVLLLVLTGVVLGLVGWWYHVSHRHYTGPWLRPGGTYQSGQRTLVFDPQLKLESPTRALSPEFLAAMEVLLQRTHTALQALQVPYWITGGTLLGWVRHQHFIPVDDDIDVSVPWDYKDYLFSPSFAEALRPWQLEVLVLRGVGSIEWATKEGAAVRLRAVDTTTPVLDIFFTQEVGSTFVKVDAWRGENVTLSQREIWQSDWLLPLQIQTHGPLTASVPHQPLELLKQQYGPRALTEMRPRSPWISHQFPFEALSWVWGHPRGPQRSCPSLEAEWHAVPSAPDASGDHESQEV